MCQVFVGEITAYGANQAFRDEYVTALEASLERVLAIMSDFSAVCPLMGVCLSSLR